MCTAIAYQTNFHYFGRNLDLAYSYQESVTIAPRRFPFEFRNEPPMQQHYAMLGMAYVANGYPLYYDATNEKGLSIAGLRFPDNAHYHPSVSTKHNLASFELIPWILGRCATLEEARRVLKCVNVTAQCFRADLPHTPLHWMISDRSGSLTVESVQDGLQVYENPVGVLTNNPPFPMQRFQLQHYRHLSASEPKTGFAADLLAHPYSMGQGAAGLPGDWTSSSRFVRAAFVKQNAVSGKTELEHISQFFHLLDVVAVPRGSVRLPDGQFPVTVYSSCCNTDTGVYYYTTYENRQITGISLHGAPLDGTQLVSYPLRTTQTIRMENER